MSKSFVCFVLLALVATCALGEAHSNTPTKLPSFPSPTTTPTASPPAPSPSTATHSPSPSPSTHESSLTSSPTSSLSIPPLAPTIVPNIVTPASSISQTPDLSAAPLLNVTIGFAIAVILAALHLLTEI
ncbi:hypothetical protein ES332_A05G291900v1 [Gossypium tomentosum]|uniref:Uncharacterized protein n=1 Tax=Gossypium tomentosum TaxID=34277 RepID=A0A5D2QP25_GOSTO|nr:hypothetical protein ES332_A05G291900v1 [Gossypium tomentosum]